MITPDNSKFSSSSLSPLIVALILVLVVLALLVGGTFWLRSQLNSYPLSVQPSLAPADTASLVPPLNNVAGSLNPDNAQTQVLAALDTKTALADIQPSQGVAAINQTINQRLQLEREDDDFDGLSNSAEVLLYGTNPNYYDSDVDGKSDKNEIDQGTDPLATNQSMSAQYQQLVAQRQTYWQTNFALNPDTQAQSQRDQFRIADAGQARVLLNSYYEEHKRYPTTTTWEQTWAELKAQDAGQMFSGESTFGEAPIVDPLNQGAYVYTYQPAVSGQSFTFTYALETEPVQFVISDSRGEDQPIQRVELAVSLSPTTSSLLANVLPVAEAAAVISDPICGVYGPPQEITSTLKTKDNIEVTIHEGYCAKRGPFWVNFARNHTYAQTRLRFLQAIAAETAKHGQSAGYCTTTECYCRNGATMFLGKPPIITPAPTTLTCSPASQDLTVGQVVNVRATGGTGSYSWSAPTGNPSTGSGLTFATVYSTPEDKKITVTSGAQTAQCIAGVRGIFTPTPTLTPTPTPVVTTKTQCNDGLDNDDDGRIDCTPNADPACHVDHSLSKACDPNRLSENDPHCSDLKDNDKDGRVDSADPGCRTNISDASTYNPADNSEANPPFNPGGIKETE